MPTAAQLDANRANAQLSTGPKTEAGNAQKVRRALSYGAETVSHRTPFCAYSVDEASKNNAFKHGFTSRQIVLSSEDRQAFEQLHAGAGAEFAPVGLAEERTGPGGYRAPLCASVQ
ncbi:MAG: hypothetical protein ABI165_17685 [Bryobacteraceae bacterium]